MEQYDEYGEIIKPVTRLNTHQQHRIHQTKDIFANHLAQPDEEKERFERSSWNKNWVDVAFATCNGRVDDGLSKRLVRLPDGTTISQARWRKEALKAYGNAIVPAVAVQIMRSIREVQNGNS